MGREASEDTPRPSGSSVRTGVGRGGRGLSRGGQAPGLAWARRASGNFQVASPQTHPCHSEVRAWSCPFVRHWVWSRGEPTELRPRCWWFLASSLQKVHEESHTEARNRGEPVCPARTLQQKGSLSHWQLQPTATSGTLPCCHSMQRQASISHQNHQP